MWAENQFADRGFNALWRATCYCSLPDIISWTQVDMRALGRGPSNEQCEPEAMPADLQFDIASRSEKRREKFERRSAVLDALFSN